jgi:hypothetical protein
MGRERSQRSRNLDPVVQEFGLYPNWRHLLERLVRGNAATPKPETAAKKAATSLGEDPDLVIANLVYAQDRSRFSEHLRTVCDRRHRNNRLPVAIYFELSVWPRVEIQTWIPRRLL